MKEEDQQAAIVAVCGWRSRGTLNPGWQDPSGGWHFEDRDYLHDLNAMHEAEKVLKDSQINIYVSNLWRAMHLSPEAAIGTIHATASQRAEALLKTLGLWKD